MPLPRESRYTLADVLTWPEEERAELIDGAPVMMAPPSRVHQEIVAELHPSARQLPGGKGVPGLPRPLCRPAL